jgi:hypothetical protein
MKAIKIVIGTLIIAAAFLPRMAATQTAIPQSSYVNFEGAQTSPVRLSADGSRLFAVNTPDARVSVFDLSDPTNPARIAEVPVGIEPVSVSPRTSDEVWVVNQVSDSISVVSVSQGIVTDTIYVKDEPADVVFVAGKAFVSVSRSNAVRVFDATTHAQIASIRSSARTRARSQSARTGKRSTPRSLCLATGRPSFLPRARLRRLRRQTLTCRPLRMRD